MEKNLNNWRNHGTHSSEAACVILSVFNLTEETKKINWKNPTQQPKKPKNGDKICRIANFHPAVNETKPEDAQRGRINEANEGISE